MTSTPRASTAVIYDPNAVNPYGAELSRLLQDYGVSVQRFASRDSEWDPTPTRRVLPASARPRRVLAQAVDQLVAPLRASAAARSAGGVLVVAWTRSGWEEWVFGALGRRHPVVFVHHNPDGREGLSRLRARVRSRLLHAAVPVVHARALISHLSHSDQARHRVVVHAPYVQWRNWVQPQVTPADRDGRLRLLLLGNPRDDKGLPGLADLVRPVLRDQVRLLVAGKGSLAAWLGASVPATVQAFVEDRTRGRFLSAREFAACLMDGDVLLAPYTGATQSGTVAMALTWGLGVIAYSSGGLRELVTGRSLAPVGDMAALRQLVNDYATAPWACAQLPTDAWRERAARDWLAVLALAITPASAGQITDADQALAR